MKDKKLQVFVSSTYTDLIVERQAAVQAILTTRNIPAGMELFAAGDENQMTVIERWIDESDVYLLLLGGRYGTVDKRTGKSYTHLEYEYAVSKGKPLFAVVIKPNALEEKVKNDGLAVLEQEHQKELKNFREIVTGNLVEFWEDTKDIELAIHKTLAEFSYTKKLIGWIRGDSNLTSPLLAEQVAQLSKENSDLRERLEAYQPIESKHFSGLTYQQLKKALQAIELGSTEYLDLYEFLIKKGESLATEGLQLDRTSSGYKKLRLYKLIAPKYENSAIYAFTDDGHDFYLRSITN